MCRQYPVPDRLTGCYAGWPLPGHSGGKMSRTDDRVRAVGERTRLEAEHRWRALVEARCKMPGDSTDPQLGALAALAGFRLS